MLSALINGRILTDHGIRDGLAVVLENDRIRSVIPEHELPGQLENRKSLEGNFLLPGFIDIQVNGGNGLLFNDAPTVETIQTIGDAHRQFGTTGFLPTLISDDLDVIKQVILAVNRAIKQNIKGVLGIHIEGPFLNPERKGIHDVSRFRQLNDEAIALLSSSGSGKTLVTLAPEQTTPDLIRKLVDNSIIVSAGHSNASYEVIQTALANGLTGFTHLFNAMPALSSRFPGIVGAALEDQHSWCSIIVDGHHVHPMLLRLAMSCKAKNRLILITDAMSSVGTDLQTFTLQGRTITVENGKCTAKDGTLAGSHLDMASAIRNSMALLNVDFEQAVFMASRYPAEFLGLENELGSIKQGYRANLVLADKDLNILDTWINGQSTSTTDM